MTFEEMLDHALAMLQRRGRVTDRALTLQFRLDDDHLEALTEELLYAHPHVVEDGDRGLIWTGETRPTPTPGSPPASDQERAPLSYTPAHLTEKILQARLSLEGERKPVTVLFADLKGSMALLADRDPEEARTTLDPVLERMMEVVAVVGEAGVGKSRLVYEFVHSHHTPGWLVLESASVSYGKATPYVPVIDLLKRYAHLEELDDLRTIGGDVALRALANRYLGFVYKAQGDYRRAIDCFEQTVTSLEGALRRERFGQAQLPAVSSRAMLAECDTELGTFVDGRALGEEGLRIAEAVDHPTSLVVACRSAGLLALRQGDLARALPLFERAIGFCQEADLLGNFPLVAGASGAAYILAGRVADAMPLLTQAMEQTTATERVDAQAFCRLALGEAQLLTGRLEEAQTLAERALALTCEHQERGHQAYALRLLGEIAAQREPPERERAEAHYRQALALAEELGMRPLQAHCHRSLGTLYAMTGQREQARAKLDTAMALYRTMEMTLWLPQAEAALAQIV